MARIASRRASRAAVGEQLRDDAVGLPSVDDVHRAHAACQRVQHRLHLDVHAPLDASAQARLQIGGADLGDQLPFVVEDAGDVGQEDQPLGAASGRDLTGRDVRVDVVAGSVLAEPDRRDHRRVAALEEHVQQVGVDGLDLADEPEVGLARRGLQLVRGQQAPILP
jgi:hypothetical protein